MTTNTFSHLPASSAVEETFQTAVAQHRAGQLQEAGALYRTILEAHPEHPEVNHNMGALAVQMNQPTAGLPFFVAALESDPARRQYWVSYIDALLQANQVDEAQQILTLAQQQGLQGEDVDALADRLQRGAQAAPTVSQNIKKKPKAKTAKSGRPPFSQGKAPDPSDLNTLVALFNTGHYTESATLAQAITARHPQHGLGWMVLGAAFKNLGRIEDALVPMQTAAKLAPDDANAHSNLGATLQDLERMDEAEASLRRALKINPNHAQAHCNLGVTLQALGRMNEAEASLLRALQINPDNAQAHNNLGNTLKALGRLDQAEASYRRTLQISPDFAAAHYNLGITLQERGRLEDAEASYREALRFKPDYALAHNNLAVALVAQGRADEAETSYRRALQINPDYADAHCNLGAALMSLSRPAEAEASYRRALEINPDSALALSNLGVTLQDLGRLDAAEASYRRALEIKPDLVGAFDNLLFVLNYHPDKSAEEIFKTYQHYDAHFGLPHKSEWRPHSNRRTTQRRLKIGYVSPDFKQHSARHFLEPLLAHHDKKVVEVVAYAELTREDAMTARYKSYVDHWVPTRGLSDDQLEQRIRADEIDILVDLAGHTDKNRLAVFARKPAPVSLTWLGYGYSTGLSAIDYILTDDTSAPPGSDHLFSEKPWRLTTPDYVYAPADGMGDVNPLPALSTGHITFGTLTRAIRINHRVIRVWSEILKRLPTARLVIDSKDFHSAAAQDALAERFAAHGIARAQLHIGCNSPPWDVLRGLDIGLDCFPHNSGTTLFEMLYLGVPYITLAGRPSVGRLGSSILVGAAHPELISHSEAAYVEKAIALASDLPKLAALRAGLRQDLRNGPLMNGPAFARKVETAYREMFERWAASIL